MFGLFTYHPFAWWASGCWFIDLVPSRCYIEGKALGQDLSQNKGPSAKGSQSGPLDFRILSSPTLLKE
jgi:hypothetical protein